MKRGIIPPLSISLLLTPLLWIILCVTGQAFNILTIDYLRIIFAGAIIVAPVIAGCICNELQPRRLCFIALISFAIISCAIFIETILPDYSSDGIVYHQKIIEAMLNGWNPLYDILPYSSLEDDINALLQHYACGLEKSGLPIVAATKSIQSGKALNLVLPIATALIIYSLSDALSLSKRILFVIIITANPVVVSQLFTFYNDSLLYSESILLISGYLIIRSYPDKFPVGITIMIIATLFATSSKFTHFFYIGLIWGGVILWDLISSSECKILRAVIITSIATATAAFGFLLLNYHPYLTNILHWGNPVYPLWGGELDIMTDNTPDIFWGHNRFVNFIMAQFSSLETPWVLLTDPLSLRIDAGMEYGARTLPFGVLFPFMTLCSLILLALSRRRLEETVFCGIIIILTFCFEQAWWARYAPFIWGIIGISLLYYWRWPVRRFHRLGKGIAYITVALTLITISLCLKKDIGGALRQKRVAETTNICINVIKNKIPASQIAIFPLSTHQKFLYLQKI